MNTVKLIIKITGQILFVINFIFFSTLQAKNFDKHNNANSISNYFSGILLLNQSKYNDSYKHLKRLEGLEESHDNYSSKYLYTLVNSGNLNQAFIFAKKLERLKQDSFESDLIIGIYHLKNSNNNLSKKYFLQAKKRNSRSILDSFIVDSLFIWSDLKNNQLNKAKADLKNLDNRFENLKKIQNVFLNCYFNSNNTEIAFKNLVSDQKTDFSRYNYFFAKFLEENENQEEAIRIIKKSYKKYPRNLLINQYRINFNNLEKNFKFSCKNEKHIIAEFLYIAANALSSQSIYSLSNFYLNLSKYLNEDFYAFDTLLAENFYNIEDFISAKKIYKKMKYYGSAFKWYSDKQISRILLKEEKKEKSLSILKKSYDDLKSKGLYETFDYAEFLKNNEEFKISIKYYTEIINQIDETHPLYPEVRDGRGVAFERIGEWENAEKDLLKSLEVLPDQAYVINYLAYSWIEKGVKINQSLEMLKKANKLKSNDPFIIDSLGWALFKLKKYKESKNYLQLAVRLLPADPIVNDHFGDVLWKNGKKIQARYYWNYVLGLKKADQDLRKNIEKKLIEGL